MRPRIIPVLLLDEGGLIKTVKFKRDKYLGDPINALRLYNDMEVDELVLLDIKASKERRAPDLEALRELASEAFMPMCYGGGVKTVDEIGTILRAGFEKVSLNAAILEDRSLLERAAAKFGSQSVVASVDIKRNLFGKYRVYNHATGKNTKFSPEEYLQEVVDSGAGEVLLNSVDQDGKMTGYDLGLLERVANRISVPLVVCGGAGHIDDFPKALKSGADACAAGSLFVYQSKSKGVLINYPGDSVLEELLEQ